MIESVEEHVGLTARERGCPPPELVAAFAGDGLSDDLRREISTHLATCAACRALAADLAQLTDIEPPARLEARVLSERSEPGSRERRALLVAAAVLAAIGLGAWWRVHSNRPDAPPSMTARAAAAAVAPAATPRWSVEKPALVLSAAVLVMRGADQTGAALATALEPYRRDDFRGSATSLAAFTAAHPDSADAWFYLGASRVLINADGDARTALEKARSLGAAGLHPELDWLLATAEARTGDLASAARRLDAVCSGTSPLRARGCQARQLLR
jgi:hypothetical protein